MSILSFKKVKILLCQKSKFTNSDSHNIPSNDFLHSIFFSIAGMALKNLYTGLIINSQKLSAKKYENQCQFHFVACSKKVISTHSVNL